MALISDQILSSMFSKALFAFGFLDERIRKSKRLDTLLRDSLRYILIKNGVRCCTPSHGSETAIYYTNNEPGELQLAQTSHLLHQMPIGKSVCLGG